MRWMLIQRTIFIEPNERVGFTYMKKGSNLRWSLIQCSGGDEGDRTPDLLTASQALSQLSYAPVRRSTIRELGPRCKDNFGKTFRGRGRRSPSMPAQPAGRAPRAWSALPPPAHQAPLRPPPGPPPRNRPIYYVWPTSPTMASRAKIKPQVDGLLFSRNKGYGLGVGVKRSRWAGFVAGASQAADRGRPEVSKAPV